MLYHVNIFCIVLESGSNTTNLDSGGRIYVLNPDVENTEENQAKIEPGTKLCCLIQDRKFSDDFKVVNIVGVLSWCCLAALDCTVFHLIILRFNISPNVEYFPILIWQKLTKYET